LKSETIGHEKNLETIQVSFDPGDIQPLVQKEIQQAQKNYSFPGFRKGKVPLPIIKKMLNEESLKASAVEELLYQFMEGELKNKDLLLLPEVVSIDMESENPLAKVNLHHRPQVHLPDFAALEVERIVPDEKTIEGVIQEQLQYYREANAILEPKDGPIAYGDTARLRYEVFNEQGRELYKSDSLEYIISEEDKRPIIEAVVNRKAGEEVEFERTFPKSQESESSNDTPEMASFTYHVHVEEVYSRTLPEVNDAFASQVDEKLETVEQLKKKIEDDARAVFAESADEALVSRIAHELGENTQIDISPETIDVFVRKNVQKLKEEDKYQKEVEKSGSEESFLEKLHEQMLFDLREYQAIEKIMKEEGLEVSEEEIKEHIEKMASRYYMEPEKLRALYQKDPDLKSEILFELRKQTVGTFLKDKVQVVEREVGRETENPEPQEVSEE